MTQRSAMSPNVTQHVTSNVNPNVTPVILCGGSGTRLWPLSRQSFPKQFVPLIDHKSLLQLTLERVSVFHQAPILIGSDAHQFMMQDVLDATYVKGSNGPGVPDHAVQVILEPVARNTAAAMALAALRCADEPDRVLLFCPADHHIPDVDLFAQTVLKGVASACAGQIVTFGVLPSYPSTAYGYIEVVDKRSENSSVDVLSVARFIEKPSADVAQSLILTGQVFWNAGIFMCTVQTLLQALKEHAPDILLSCEQALQSCQSTLHRPSRTVAIEFVKPAQAAMESCRAQSIDYAVMEHAQDIALVKFTGQWSDVGSWNAVAELTPADASGNRIEGQGHTHLSRNTFIHAPHRPVVALGTEDLLIIDTPDAVLVAAQSHAEQVKEVVNHLQKQNASQAVMHRKVARPWGWYDSIDRADRFQVKRIGVKPGASLSLQKHHHRAEHWIVVRGTAEVTRGTQTFTLTENQSTYIPIGEIHRLTNPGVVELEMIEIQSGSYLGEDDIVRLEDIYGRVKSI